MFFAVIATVSFGTHIYTRSIVEVYCKKIILSEDIVFDDKSTLNHYGKTIKLNAGTTGEIRDMVNYRGDEVGYDFIRADFVLEDGTMILAVIPIDSNGENNSSSLIIDADKIENGHTIIYEYIQSRESYYSRKKNTYIIGLLIGIASSCLFIVIFTIIYKCLLTHHKSLLFLKRTMIILDIAFALLLLLELNYIR